MRNKKYLKKLVYIERIDYYLYYIEYKFISGINICLPFTPDKIIDVGGL